jgi:ATP-binding cassette subfamily C protein
VRKQIGVVMQNSRVMGGDIYTNIVGSTGLTQEDAWNAARNAALDKDIEAMPMGMHTVIAQGGGTLSGGQRQRLLIARALAADPRVVFFDEATSALDNVTQATVSESLESLRVTRVVIAHRLSTIRHADKIIVLEKGRVVQMGRYEELVDVDGPFQRLAKRQLV